MKTKLACLLVPILALAATAFAKGPDFKDHLGIQMWSLRETTKESGPLKSLDLVKNYGLTEVETAGFGDLTAEQYAAELKARGLKAIGAHYGYDALKNDLDGAIKAAKAIGATYIICPWLPHEKSGFDDAQARKLAADFNAWGKIVSKAGLKLGVHPHGFEFVPSQSKPGETAFDVFASETDPKNVVFEMDVFWVFHAGQDPVKMLEKYGKRWALLHVKDIRKGAVTGLSTGGAPPTDNVPVGEGQIDWPNVLRTAQKVGVKHYLIEDETPAALQCIPKSLSYLRGLKL